MAVASKRAETDTGDRLQATTHVARAGQLFYLAVQLLDCLLSVVPHLQQELPEIAHHRRELGCLFGKQPGQHRAQRIEALSDLDATVEQEAADLVGERQALLQHPVACPVQRLHVHCSSVRTGTKRMVGSTTASEIASASLKSFFCDFTNGLTNCAGNSLTVWPSAKNLRAKYCEPQQVSMPITLARCCAIN